MGLDIIEMCMDIEEAFDIDVPNDEWEQAVTVGKIYETVCRHLDRPVAEDHEKSEEWQKLVGVIAKSASVKESDLHYYAHIVEDLRLD